MSKRKNETPKIRVVQEMASGYPKENPV